MRKLYLFALASLALPVSVMAQQFASLGVSVSDPQGHALPRAGVSVRNLATDAERELTSDDAGRVIFQGLPAGQYVVTVTMYGFSRTETPITLSVAQDASLAIKPQLATVVQTVEVSSNAEGVNSSDTQVSQVVSPQQIQDLPISDRDFIDFVTLTPNENVGRSTSTAAQSAFQETVLQISFAGLTETHSTFYTLDGIDYTTSISGVQRESPSLDWVQEFRVTYGPSTAETGLSLGSVVTTVTKSGTNTLHGGVYEYFRNNALDADNLLSAPGFDVLRFNQFGANLGGPIRKDKSFFFAGYEGQRSARSPIYSRFILNCIDSPGCLGPGTPSINQVKQALGLSPENLRSFVMVNDYDKEIGKYTHTFSGSSTLNLIYLYNNVHNGNTPSASPGQGLPSTYRDNSVYDQTASATFFHTFNPHWSSESGANYGRRIFYFNPVGAGFEPEVQVADTLETGGFLGGVSFYSENYFESREHLSYTRDRHTVDFGANYEPVWIGAQTPYFTPGVGIFSPQSFFGAGPFSSAPFGPGTAVEFIFHQARSEFGQQIPARTLPFQTGFYAGPDGAARQSADALRFLHQLLGLYVQDHWKATDRLTLTAGLRYDVDVLPSASDLRIIGSGPATDFGDVQPRIGLSYSFREGKSVIRSGYGIFRGSRSYSNLLNGWHGASAFTSMQQPLLPQFADPSQDLVGFGEAGMVGAAGPVAAGSAFRNFAATGAYPAPSRLVQFPLGFVSRKYPIQFAEQANLQVENQLGKDWVLETGYSYLHADHLPNSLSINGVPAGTLPDGRQKFTPADPRFGFALYSAATGWSLYNAGTVSLRKTMSHHYSLMANYTYSKSIDIATEGQLQDEPQDYLNPSLDRAVGDNDVRHRLTLTAMLESPESWAAPLRGYRLSVLNTLQSGQPYSILAGSDINGDGFPFNDRVGSIGRNSYLGAPYYDTDLRLQRLFHLSEHTRLNLSAEAFNLLNVANVQDVDQVYGSGEFLGPVPKHFGDGIISPANPNFGTPTFAGAARQLQFSAAFSF